MRKVLIAVLTAVAVLAAGGIAYAVNEYTVDGSTRPGGKGSAKKPKPVSLSFDYTVENDVAANLASPVKGYRIGAEGLVTYPEAFPNCTYTQAANPDPEAAQSACKKARVGGGVVVADVGQDGQPKQGLLCVLELNLYNLKPGNAGAAGRVGKKNGALAIRLDAGPPAPTEDSQVGQCIASQHTAILAPFFPVKINGVKADELRFDVPEVLLHPGGLDVAVRRTTSEVLKKVARKRIGGKRRKIGYYSSVGCKGRQRTIRVTFDPETGSNELVTKNGRC